MSRLPRSQLIPSKNSLDLLASFDTSAQINAIEEMIQQGADMPTVARLLCLASITIGGIKARSLDGIKREFLQVSLIFDIPSWMASYNHL